MHICDLISTISCTEGETLWHQSGMEGQLTFRISSGFRWRRTRSSTLTTGIVNKRDRSWLYREPVQGDWGWGMLFVDKIWFSPFAIGGREKIVGEIRCQWISVFLGHQQKQKTKRIRKMDLELLKRELGIYRKSGLKVSEWTLSWLLMSF